ncbi:MAG: hypothetical protein IKH57_04450 [Clostridia bacterium]|nr:hypothetical protein [Clostridia bacterium]
MMKKLVSVMLLIVLLCEALPVEALAYGGKVLTQAEIARAKALTGLSFGKEANTTAYHSGMKPNAGWNASQLRDWLDEKLDKDLNSVCDTFSQAFFTLAELKQSDPGKYRTFIESELYETAKSLSLQAEGLREDMRYYRDQLVQASGVIAEMSRWITEESSARFDSDQARYSMRIEEAAQEIVEIRQYVVENADGWTADIIKLQQPDKFSEPGIGNWMTGLLTGNDELIVESAPITRVSAANTRANRLMRASGLADDQEATVTVYSDNEVVILLQAEVDGALVAVDGASVTFRDALNPDSQWEERPYDNGCVLVPINKLTADEFEVFHLALNIDPTGQGYREISFEDLDLERGAPYTCILTPLDSPTNSLADASPYAYMMSFNGKDIMQSEYEMIYSPANDYEFEIHVGIKNPSGQTLPTLLMRYYEDTFLVPQKECWVEPVRQEGDVYVFKGPWKQTFSPYAEEGPTFMFGQDAPASMTFPSQLVSVKGATDNPINEGTGPDGGVFANVLGEGLSMNFKIPVIDVNIALKLPLKQYLPKLCINPGGYIVIYVGSDMMKDDISKISWANWQSKDLKEFKRAQKFVEKKGADANLKAQYGLAKDFYQDKRFKCLANTSLEVGWYAVATGRWELDDSIPDILSKDVTLKLGTGFTASLAVSWTLSYPIFGPVPAYVTFTIGLSAGFAMEFSLYLNWVNGQFQDWEFIPIGEITIDIGLLVAAQLGIGIKGFVEGFVKLAASLDVILHLSMGDLGSLRVMFELNLTVGVTVFFVTVSKSWNLARVQLYPSEDAGNLLAHFMKAGNGESEAQEPAYGEPHSYPALAAEATEMFPYASGNEGYPYKIVYVNGKGYAFSIFKVDSGDGNKHSRVGWECLTLSERHTLQEMLNDGDVQSNFSTWIDAINERDDYDFDVYSDGRFVYVIATCAKDFDDDGYPVPDDMSTDTTLVKNMIAYVTVLEADDEGNLSYMLSVTQWLSSNNFVFAAASVQGDSTNFRDLSYDSVTRPRIAFARQIWIDPMSDLFDHFEFCGEMTRVAYPNDDSLAGATGFIYQGENQFSFLTDRKVQSAMGDGYERTKVMTFDSADSLSHMRSAQGYSMSFVALSRPKDGGSGDNVIEAFIWSMNTLDNINTRKAIVLEQGAIENLALLRDPEHLGDAGVVLFFTETEVSDDGAEQRRLYGLYVSPTQDAGSSVPSFTVTKYVYDVVIPASRFDVRYIGPVPYLTWVSLAPKKNDSDPDVWQAWIMAYDMATNSLADPAVFAEFKLPQITFDLEYIQEAFDAALSSVMLTGTGTSYLNAVPENMDIIPKELRPKFAPTSLLSFAELLTPSAILTAAIPKEVVIRAGGFDDMTLGMMNDGNLGITAFDIGLYDVTKDGSETLVETIHFDALNPDNSSVTMADGTVVRSGEAAAYRQEDYDSTSRKRDWVLDHETTAYNLHVVKDETTVTTEVVEPSDPQHIMTDVLMPGSVGGYTAAFKIPDDWEGGTRTLRMKITALSINTNWMRAAALAAGARVNSAFANAAEECATLTYTLNNRTGKLELQKPANATGALADALNSGLYANEIKGASVPLTVQVHDLEVSHRVYRGLGGERWLDISIRNHAATREGMKLVCAVYVDGAEEPSHYINLPYYEDAALSHKTQTVSLPVSALVDDPGAHRTARLEILSVDRKERAYANNEFTVYLDGKDKVHFIQQPEDVIAQAGEDVSFSVAADGGRKPYGYQWQVWDENHRKWVDQPGFTDPTLTWKNIGKERDGWKVRCVVTDAAGTEIISREATLNVWGDVPTGDSSNLPMYLTVAALALAAMVVLWRRRRKA